MKIKIFLITSLIFSTAFSIFAAGENIGPIKTTCDQLISRAKEFNNKIVIIKGEVIGDIMLRGDFAWFNIRDDFNAIGIWAPKNLTTVIGQAGNYQHRGDIVEVEGKFFRADPLLDGELCIRAQKINVAKQGYRIFHVLKPAKEETAYTLSIVALCFALASFFIRKQKKKKFNLKG